MSNVLIDGWSIDKLSKFHNVPFNSLKRYLTLSPGPDDVPEVNKRRPIALTGAEEQSLVSLCPRNAGNGLWSECD